MSNPDDHLIPPPDDVLVDASQAASAAAATSTGPPPSSETPGADQEPLPQPGTDEQQPEEDAPSASEFGKPKAFNPMHKDPFIGLVFLGALEETVTVWGHTFHLMTPSQAERMQLGLLHGPYQGTLASEIAYQTIFVAAYLRTVDGTELPKPVTNDTKDQALHDRFKWVAENLRESVIDELFSKCLVLQKQVRGVLEAMGEASG